MKLKIQSSCDYTVISITFSKFNFKIKISNNSNMPGIFYGIKYGKVKLRELNWVKWPVGGGGGWRLAGAGRR